MRCNRCGAKLNKGDSFCTQCGAPVLSNSSYGAIPNRSSNALWIVIIAIAAVITIAAVIIIAVILTGQNKSSENKIKKADKKTQEAFLPETQEETVKENETKEKDTKETAVRETVSEVDIQARISKYGEEYDAIEQGMELYAYDSTVLRPGVIALSEQGQLKAISVGGSGGSYAKCFYYYEGELFFATYVNTELHWLFYDEGQLIRWTYYSNPDDMNQGINHDMENSTEFYLWEKRGIDDAAALIAEWQNILSSGSSIAQITDSHIQGAIASSYLIQKDYNLIHSPERVLDGNLTTGWVEGASGQGIGEYITLLFDGVYMVSGIQIYAGYHKSNDLYYMNSRPKQVTIKFSDSSEQTYILDDVMSVQYIEFSSPVATDSIALYMDSVYPGSKFEDTVITEMHPY